MPYKRTSWRVVIKYYWSENWMWSKQDWIKQAKCQRVQPCRGKFQGKNWAIGDINESWILDIFWWFVTCTCSRGRRAASWWPRRRSCRSSSTRQTSDQSRWVFVFGTFWCGKCWRSTRWYTCSETLVRLTWIWMFRHLTKLTTSCQISVSSGRVGQHMEQPKS